MKLSCIAAFADNKSKKLGVNATKDKYPWAVPGCEKIKLHIFYQSETRAFFVIAVNWLLASFRKFSRFVKRVHFQKCNVERILTRFNDSHKSIARLLCRVKALFINYT